MSRWTAILIAAFATAAYGVTDSMASVPPAARDADRQPEASEVAEVPPPIVRSEAGRQQIARPVFGSGYVPYGYPAFDTCPCDDAGCYHPGWYYCGGKPYRRAWWRRWIGAHLGRGSMLDGYPCHCVYPTFGRPYHVPAVEAATVESEVQPAESPPATSAP